MIATSMGKRLRMRRVFRDGKALILPIDHPVYYGPLSGTEDPGRLVALARDNGATAVLATAGALRAAIDEIGDLGIVMRVDSPVSHLGGLDSVRHLLHSAGQAASLGADMVIINCYLGMGDTAVESAMLKTMADVSAECERLGLPMCAEIIPQVPTADGTIAPPSSADLATAIRLGLEYDCDVVKTVYNGDPEGFAKAVATGHLPVIMAGGPKTADDLAVFRQAFEAMSHGASGIVVGRRVWGSGRPVAAMRAMRAIVFEGKSGDAAVAIYRRGRE
jgi:fructose-bisphosphate aldolase / 2-amino-3,7-dideoxy-D-threo-hept-6-ulosonate synthase